MQTYEPNKWRTDLVVFIEKNHTYFDQKDYFLNELNCKFENLRKLPEDKPMCTLIDFVPLDKRKVTGEKSFKTPEELYAYLLKDVNIFEDNLNNLSTFYKSMQKEIGRYSYLNSILMAFEGYKYIFK